MSSAADLAAALTCQFCKASFSSRNALFKHLRGSESCVEDKQQLGEAPSVLELQAKQEKERKRQEFISRRRPTAKPYELEVDCLWFGDLPLPWTRLGGNYKRLKAMVRSLLPDDIPNPWVKYVKRKAYRNSQGVYLGYAIIAFRDKEECQLVEKLLDGTEVALEKIFKKRDSTSCKDFDEFLNTKLPPFCLHVREYEKSTSSEQLPPKLEITTTISSGLDPPLTDQLRPLSSEELSFRWSKLSGTALRSDDSALSHQDALERAVSIYEQCPNRPTICSQGRDIPTPICDRLRHILQNLRWKVPNDRRCVSAERYLVLLSKVSNDVVYSDLRAACKELMDWADQSYHYSGVAVTKNFVGSPHIDHRDRDLQYAISFGDVDSGGELCVDGVDNDGNEVIHVVTTLNRIAAIDGRRVHWVRPWVGKDRYSLIFYNTTGEEAPRLVTGICVK